MRYNRAGFAGNLDRRNERLLLERQRGGSSYLSNARLAGRFALRGCILNHATAEANMGRVLDNAREAGGRVVAGCGGGHGVVRQAGGGDRGIRRTVRKWDWVRFARTEEEEAAEAALVHEVEAGFVAVQQGEFGGSGEG